MRYKKQVLLENGLCVAALVLCALLPLLFTFGHAPYALDGVFSYPPWDEARPAGIAPPTAPADAPEAQRYLPWYVFLNHAGPRLDALLWNPLEGGGVPFFAVWRTRCLSPFSIPFYLFPVGAALPLSFLLKLVVAGGCAYYAARRFRLAPVFALAVGIAFEFSGHVFWAHCRPVSDVVPWLPLLILYIDGIAEGRKRYWPFAALTISLMACGGDPEILGVLLVFAAIYFVLQLGFIRWPVSQFSGLITLFVLAVIAGLALVAVQILPYIEFLREAAATGREPPGLALEWRDLAVWFLPDFAKSTPLRALHFGLVQLCLIPLWFSVRRFVDLEQRQRVDALVVPAALLIAAAFVADRFSDRLPFLAHFGPEHWTAGAAFALALMGAVAAEAWIELDAAQCKSALKRLAIGVPLLIAGSVASVVVAWHNPGIGLSIAILFGVMILLIVLLGLTLVRPSAYVMGGGLALLTLISLLIGFRPALHAAHAASVFPETSFISTLSSSGERINGSNALSRWPLSGNLIPQVYTPAGVTLKRQAAFLERMQNEPMLLRRAGAPALLLTREDVQGAFAGIRPVLAIKYVFSSGAVLFRDLEAKPRAWIAHEWRPVEAFDPSLLSSSQPPLVESGPPANPAAAGPSGKVKIVQPETPTQVELNVDTLRPGILILADARYPGWQAAVDGEPVPIFPVEGLFRGVAVKEGTHQVEFRYNPLTTKIGFGITLAAALIILVEMRHSLFHWLRRRRGES